jgi:putative transposase
MQASVIRGDNTLAELAAHFQARPNQITQGRASCLSGCRLCLTIRRRHPRRRATARPGNSRWRIFLRGRAQYGGIVEHSTAYCRPEPVPESGLALVSRIDELHLRRPFPGARRLRDLLNTEGFDAGRKHVATPMRRVGISALYRKPKSSMPGAGSPRVYPYLLRNLVIDRPPRASIEWPRIKRISVRNR